MKKVNKEESEAVQQVVGTAQERSQGRVVLLTQRIAETVNNFLAEGNEELTTNEITMVCLKLAHGYTKLQIETDNRHADENEETVLESGINEN
jgi:hypothetical protein